MLANLLSEAHIHSFIHKATDAAKHTEIYKKMFHDSTLPSEASAQWYAGLLYAYTYQKDDHRDYIVDCSIQIDMLDGKLVDSFGQYHDEKYKDGNQIMKDTEVLFRESMINCYETNALFEEMVSKTHHFFERSDWQDTVKTNYEANQTLVEHQEALMLKEWDEGVYFSAGMFYGRVWYILAQGHFI